jgi:hypothetical protein
MRIGVDRSLSILPEGVEETPALRVKLIGPKNKFMILISVISDQFTF